MSAPAVLLLVVAAFDPLAVAGRLGGVSSRSRLAGLAAAAIAAVGLVWVAVPLLDALSIEPESFWIAAGLVLAVGGLVRVVVPRGGRAGSPGTDAHWLVPIAYPGVLGPELVLAAMAAGAHGDRLVGSVAVAGAAAAVLLGRPGPVVAAAAERMVAAIQVVLAIALVVDGIRGV